MGLQQFEQRLERLVEGAFAKAFRGELQPIELGRRLTREMDLHRAVTTSGLVAPNSFDIELASEDFERFGGFVSVLARELVDAAREHARAEHYTFLGPVEVVIGASDELTKTTFSIVAEVKEGADRSPGTVVLPDGRRIPVTDEGITIGRLPECEIQLLDPNVSRRHAEFRTDGEMAYIVDLGSTNGTKVNGATVRQQRLVDGDLVTVGTTSMRFEAG
jgi:hypothetical protein